MKSNKTITIILSLLLVLTLTACTEERPPIIINNPTDSSLFVLKSGDTMTGALIVNNTLQVKNGFPNEGVSIIGGDLWATGSIFLLGNLTAVNINTITLNDTDSIRAGSSSGLLIEANNGVDVAHLGLANTANTLFYGTIIAPTFQGNITSTNATITTLDVTGSLTSGETRINNRGNINTNSSLNLLVTGLGSASSFNVSHNIFVNHTGLPTPTAGRSLALMGQYVLSPNNAMTAHVSGFNEFTAIIPNTYTTVSTIGTLRTNSVYAINDATSSTAGTVTGLFSYAQMTGEGSIGRLSSVEPTLLVSSTGNITNALGILHSISHTGTGTITNYRGLWINTLTNSGGGTITNTYGIYMGDITSGTQTNQAYNIYLEDVNARNYLAGNTIINGSLTNLGTANITTGVTTGTLTTTGQPIFYNGLSPALYGYRDSSGVGWMSASTFGGGASTYQTSASHGFYIAGAQEAVITSDGLGINGVTPASGYAIDASGQNIRITSSTQAYFRAVRNTTNHDAAMIFGTTTPATTDWLFGTLGASLSGNTGFHLYNSPAGQAYLTVANTSYVGIGTTTPRSKLDVNGNLNVTGNIQITGCLIYNGGTLGVCV